MVHALIACSLAMLVFGPSLDAMLCLSDGQAPVATLSDAADLSANSEKGVPHNDIGGADGLCVHGHCHHGLQYLVAALEPLPVPGATAPQHVLRGGLPAESLCPLGLERPPRA